MKLLVQYALQFVGLPYRWGGNNALTGFDCSGLVQEILASVGMDPKGRDTAKSLHDYFAVKGISCEAQSGALVFYGKSTDQITHVAFMLDANRVIEAGSGDSTTVTKEVAAAQSAVVRVRNFTARKDILDVFLPDYPKWVKE